MHFTSNMINVARHHGTSQGLLVLASNSLAGFNTHCAVKTAGNQWGPFNVCLPSSEVIGSIADDNRLGFTVAASENGGANPAQLNLKLLQLPNVPFLSINLDTNPQRTFPTVFVQRAPLFVTPQELRVYTIATKLMPSGLLDLDLYRTTIATSGGVNSTRIINLKRDINGNQAKVGSLR